MSEISIECAKKRTVIFKTAVIWQAISPLTNALLHHYQDLHSNKVVNNILSDFFIREYQSVIVEFTTWRKTTIYHNSYKQKVYVIDRFIGYCERLCMKIVLPISNLS